MHERLWTYLYVSDLAPDRTAVDVSRIARTARSRNRERGITGLLGFDGLHFMQWVEGPPAAMAALIGELGSDSRHQRIEVLHEGPADVRAFGDWHLGYLSVPDEADLIPRLRGMRDDEAIARFSDMLPALDVEIGSAMPALVARG